MKALLSVVLLTLACASAPDEARIGREIQAEYDKLASAFGRQDVAGILASRTADFHVSGPDGSTQTAAQMAEYTSNWFELNKPPIEVHFTIESVELHGRDEAAVKVLQRASRYQDHEGKRVRVQHEVEQRETWRRTPQGWRIAMVDQIDLAHRKRWIDGVLER